MILFLLIMATQRAPVAGIPIHSTQADDSVQVGYKKSGSEIPDVEHSFQQRLLRACYDIFELWPKRMELKNPTSEKLQQELEFSMLTW